MNDHDRALAYSSVSRDRLAVAYARPRPLLRGTLHGAMAIVAPFALVAMLLVADGPRGYVGASIFGAMLIALYATSASYHLAPWPTLLRGGVKRLDHAMIFALIAGTYTPFCLIVLGNAWGITMLSVVWSLAGVGMLLKIAWPGAPRALGVGLYVGLGWLGLIAAWELFAGLTATPLALLVAGGALYTAGGLAYATRWPDPWPRVFGYHEVFHSLVVAATALHFAVVVAFVL
jgi:hemolysin III